MKVYNITEDEQARLLDLATTLAAGNTEPSELEREAEVLLESMEKVRESIADALRDLRGSFAHLAELWENYPQVCAKLGVYYPFKKDFDELVFDVNHWTGYNIEKYDPAPDPVIEPNTPLTPPAAALVGLGEPPPAAEPLGRPDPIPDDMVDDLAPADDIPF